MGIFGFGRPATPDPNVVEALASQRKLIERLEGELVRANLELADARKAQHSAEETAKQALEAMRKARADFEAQVAALRTSAVPAGVAGPRAFPKPAFANTSIAAGHFEPSPTQNDRKILGPENSAA